MLSPDIKLAYTCTGQGSIQKLGLFDRLSQSQGARRIIEIADEVAGFSLSKLVAEGPLEKLRETKNAQIATIAYDLAALTVTREFYPELDNQLVATAGHSAGEIAALAISEVITLEKAIDLARQRGLLMQEYGGEGTMAAILADEETVGRICDRVNKKATEPSGKVEAVNFNGLRQIVISGPESRVMKAVDFAEELDIGYALLEVPNPFHHSVLMRRAQDEFAKVIAATEFRDARVPVILNVTGQSETSGVKIKEIVAKQIASPVLWYKSVLAALSGEGLKDKVNTFIEFGPRGILTKMLEEIDSNAKRIWIGSLQSAQSLSFA